MQKINERNSWLFKNINKLTNLYLTRLSQKHKEKTQITNIRKKRRDITTDPAVIERVVRKHCKQLYTHEFDILDENGPIPRKA